MGRNDLCFCGSGKKKKKCHGDVAETSAFAKVLRNYAEFDSEVQQYRESHNEIKCLDFCSKCCSDYFFISENEFFVALTYYISEPNNEINSLIEKASVVNELFNKYHPEELNKLHTLMPTTNQRDCFEYFFDDSVLMKTEQSCPFLSDTGSCSVYPVRPGICRLYGTIRTCRFINNPQIGNEIESKLYSNNFITNPKTLENICKRQYPIFYWIITFLSQPYRVTTMIKLEKFQRDSEERYFEFSKMLSGK